MLISVIVPVYNTEKYIKRCIESILSQTHVDFELLLINDGSKDNSGSICDYYHSLDTRVKVFHVDNNGVGKARNLGLDKSIGEWIIFIDSDDYIENDYFKVLKDTIISCNDGVESIILPNYKDEPSIPSCVLIDKLYDTSQKIDRRDLYVITTAFTRKSASVYSKMYKSSILIKNNIRFIDSSVNEDSIFNMTYFTHVNNIWYLNKAFYHYMIYTGQPSLSRITLRPYTSYIATAKHLYEKLNIVMDLIDVDKKITDDVLDIYSSILYNGYKTLYKNKLSYINRKNYEKEYSRYFIHYISTVRSYKNIAYIFTTCEYIPFLLKDFFLKLIFLVFRSK